jgi:alkylation response protein AidB-like acyl-CoA dehydrogenase
MTGLLRLAPTVREDVSFFRSKEIAMTTSSVQAYLEATRRVISDVIAPRAVEVDRAGAFPRAAIDALGKAGLLGLTMSADVGGGGQSLRAAAEVVEEIAQSCGSTAMVMCMHYTGAALLDAQGPDEVKRDIAAGRHLSSVAFSEAGSRSHFWAPLGTAIQEGEEVQLDASKIWVTSATEADSYVWSTRSLAAPEKVTLFYVPSKTPGLTTRGTFDGLGLRGNQSCPVTATKALIPMRYMLGVDGDGFDYMMEIGLPVFNTLCSAMNLGLAESAMTRTIEHVLATLAEPTPQKASDPTAIRANLARMSLKTATARFFLNDTLKAVESGREDTLLRIIEVKAAAGEAAAEVTDLGMRVCGGAAFRKEVGVDRFFRDARAAGVMAPSTNMLYEMLGRSLCKMPLFG